MVTEVHEEVRYCYSGTSSGKQKKTRFASKPQFRSGNTPVTTEASQFLLNLQKLANKSNSANFNNSIIRNSKLSKLLTTLKPMFDRKSEKVELFEHLLPQKSQPVDSRQQNQVPPLSNEGRCAADIQKH